MQGIRKPGNLRDNCRSKTKRYVTDQTRHSHVEGLKLQIVDGLLNGSWIVHGYWKVLTSVSTYSISHYGNQQLYTHVNPQTSEWYSILCSQSTTTILQVAVPFFGICCRTTIDDARSMFNQKGRILAVSSYLVRSVSYTSLSHVPGQRNQQSPSIHTSKHLFIPFPSHLSIS
jgi:hypothetical protein